MRTEVPTQEEIRRAGIEALVNALGPVGMVRFLQQFDNGSGDYTAERHEWLDGQSLEEIVEKIEAFRRRRRP